MYEENGFVPKIYLCGNKAEFFARIGQRPFKLVGELKFFGDNKQELHFNEDGKFLLDDKVCELAEMKNIWSNADYIVFNLPLELKATYLSFQKFELNPAKLITLGAFKNLPTNNFYDLDAEINLMNFLKVPPIRTLLDLDAHFAKSQLLTKVLNDVTQIDCISQEDLPAFKAENIYSHVYKNLSECRYKHYDAAIFNAATTKDFVTKVAKLEHITEVIIVYTRNDSNMSKFINNNSQIFSKINALTTMGGSWLFCYRHAPKKNFATYVVTHKELPQELVENLPSGYKIIHAGKTLSKDFGYIGDNTDDNISYLNPYINELTAFYWVWKNTNHSIVGTAHYRRFLTEKTVDDNSAITFAHEDILTEESAEKLLKSYDVLASMFYGVLTQAEEIEGEYSETIVEFARAIIEKHISNNQPEYLDAFHYVMNSTNFYRYSIIVTRKHIFDAYCKWLFSFFIDAAQEIVDSIKFGDKNKRLAAFFGERMLTVWLLKNHLRVKDLEIMQVPDL